MYVVWYLSYMPYDREANRIACQKWRHSHPEAARANSANHRKNPPSSYWRERRYGITEEQYQAMLAKQGGKCAICQETMTKVCVDHCHETKIVRGLLCDRCNTGLGKFRDDAGLIRRALEYLEV